jgi:hypothetical protein
VLLENHPGSTACSAAGVKLLATGNLNVGAWSNFTRELTFAGTSGLQTHGVPGNGVPVTWNGVFRDTQQTLQILL